MEKPYCLGFAILELCKLHRYDTYYDKIQPYFGKVNIQLHCFETDAFILSVKTKDIIEDLEKLEDLFNFSNLDGDHHLFSDRNKKVIGKLKIETP